jgi:hypothetical protein
LTIIIATIANRSKGSYIVFERAVMNLHIATGSINGSRIVGSIAAEYGVTNLHIATGSSNSPAITFIKTSSGSVALEGGVVDLQIGIDYLNSSTIHSSAIL